MEWFKSRGYHPRFLVLDQVGAGNKLRYARQVGRLRPLKTSPGLNACLCQVDPLIEPLDYHHKSGDFEAFIRAGFESASLEMTGSQKAQQAYHTCRDTLSLIETGALAHTLDVTIQLLSILDKESL